MSNSQFTPPASDELEVSLFGPGYGEAIVLHIGAGKWILVDSCIEPNSKRPAPLKYLYDLDVNVESAVKLVVATHWHDDHVRGISAIFDKCESADITISSALKVDEFLNLAMLYRKRTVRRNSGLEEFIRVFQLLETRKQHEVRFNPPKFALADKSLYRDQIQTISTTAEAKVFALSPSDASVLQAQLAFAELWPQEKDRKKRIASPTSNHTSVVLWVDVGGHKILLGADLERTADPKTGWSVILSDSTVIFGKAGVFKIPHHGSENAHYERVWSELVSEKPFAIVSPFRKGKRWLPSPSDAERITRLTPHAYTTAPARQRQQQWRNRVVNDFVKEMTKNIQNVLYGWGHIRLRQKIDEPNQGWRVELFGDAHMLK
jgi:beta-lactamase superfamily II metal-dependent hydrolase